MQVDEFQQLWNCLRACVCICACVSVRSGGRAQAEGHQCSPRAQGLRGRWQMSLEVCGLTRERGGRCFSQQAGAHFPSSETAWTASHLQKLLCRRWPAFL